MVRGMLIFEDPEAVPSGQRIRIMVRDTSRADASSVDIAQTEVVIPEGFDAEKDTLPFEIEVNEKTLGLSIQAHMPRHDDTDVRLGDMITTASIPVKEDDEVDVTLRRVV
ncbi:MAG: hypothetical protein KUG61_07435 [Parvibaculaceae bacterium]|nr:hypothetical protein [Parvibaculaceae bacterium]